MASGRSALPERRGIMYTFHSRVRYSEIDADGILRWTISLIICRIVVHSIQKIWG